LQGESSSQEEKVYPGIKIQGYQGHAVVVVSCVEADPPYKTHPHNLVGSYCMKGVCRMDINQKDMTAKLTNLGIQCVRRKDAAASLQHREAIKVDPFKTRFSHIKDSANLNAIRLCFQAFLYPTPGCKPIPVKPVVSIEAT